VDGVYSASPISVPFKGAFTGLGNVISKLEIADQADAYVGFFATLSAKGTISNVGIINAVIEGGTRQSVGGLVGFNHGTIDNSFVSGVIGNVSSSGGLVADNLGTISRCRSAGTVHGSPAGGLVSSNGGIIERSFAAATVNTSGEGGGLVGSNSYGVPGTIVDSYTTGEVTGKSGYFGGLAADNYQSSISTSYSTGAVNGRPKSTIGGSVGYSTGVFANTYWDTTTSGITDLSKGAGNVSNAPGITGLSTTQLQSGLPAGFDPAIWAENPSINGGLPYLLDNPPPG